MGFIAILFDLRTDVDSSHGNFFSPLQVPVALLKKPVNTKVSTTDLSFKGG